MAAENQNTTPNATRLFSCYLKASGSELTTNAIMLCELVGDEIQSVSLRVAADAMSRLDQGLDAQA